MWIDIRVRRVTCSNCEDTFSTDVTPLKSLDCAHTYCTSCLTDWYSLACIDQNVFPVRCCGNLTDIDSVKHLISSALAAAYEAKGAEFNTHDKLYCPQPECGVFIGEAASHATVSNFAETASPQMECPKCG